MSKQKVIVERLGLIQIFLKAAELYKNNMQLFVKLSTLLSALYVIDTIWVSLVDIHRGAENVILKLILCVILLLLSSFFALWSGSSFIWGISKSKEGINVSILECMRMTKQKAWLCMRVFAGYILLLVIPFATLISFSRGSEIWAKYMLAGIAIIMLVYVLMFFWIAQFTVVFEDRSVSITKFTYALLKRNVWLTFAVILVSTALITVPYGIEVLLGFKIVKEWTLEMIIHKLIKVVYLLLINPLIYSMGVIAYENFKIRMLKNKV